MSIGFFPKIYEDELVMSTLARYYSQSGYLSFEDAKKVLYVNKGTRPNALFINKLNEDVIKAFGVSIESLIKKHTMYLYYAKFLKEEKTERAFKALCDMEGNYNDLLSLPRTVKKRYLRYCPVCVERDLEEKGEAIWYRKHQIQGVNICPVCGYRLINSFVPIENDSRIRLYSLSEVIESREMVLGSDLEFRFSKYVSSLLDNENMNSKAGLFLKSKLKGKSFGSIYNELQDFYSGTDILEDGITEEFLVGKVLNGNRTNPLMICQIAFYLGISPYELLNCKEEITEIKKQRKSTLIKKEKTDWNKQDLELLGKVEEVINSFLNDKPRRITIRAIEKELGLPRKRLYLLPECLKLVERYRETADSFHGRQIIWSIKELEDDVSWFKIYLTTNIQYKDKEKAIREAKRISGLEILESL